MRFIEPSLGALRHRTGFLIFPRTIGRETRWLERAQWTQRYDPSFYGNGWEDWQWGHAEKHETRKAEK